MPIDIKLLSIANGFIIETETGWQACRSEWELVNMVLEWARSHHPNDGEPCKDIRTAQIPADPITPRVVRKVDKPLTCSCTEYGRNTGDLHAPECSARL
jgi:hypothetical protein